MKHNRLLLTLLSFLLLVVSACDVADAWEDTIFVTSVNASTLNGTQVTAATGNITTAYITSLNMTGDVLPTSNNTRSLGATLFRWLTGWFVNLVSETHNTTQLTATTANVSTLNAGTVNGLLVEDFLSHQSLRIGYNSGQNVTGLYNVVLGINTGTNITSGEGNHLFGTSAGNNITTGNYNNAFGDGALWGASNPTTGGYNQAFGDHALMRLTSGNYNSAYGGGALQAASNGSFNIVNGGQGLFSLTSGNRNVALGFQAGYSLISGSNNIFLGNQAGYEETSSNKLYIMNSGTPATNSFIYGEMASNPNRLFVNAISASGGGNIRDVDFNLGAHYWNGAASTDWVFKILHDMVTSGASPSSNVTFSINSVELLKLENINGTPGIYISSNGTIKKVFEGAADTGGVGYKTLIVAN